MLTMLLLFQGDWSEYLAPLALFAAALFLVALRWQTAPWLRGHPGQVAGRVLRVIGLSCLGLLIVCTAAFVGIGRLSGCPLMGDPTGTIDFRNEDSVPLIVYPEGPQVPSVRRIIAPGEQSGWGYLVSCGTQRRDDAVFRTIAAEYERAWVYCRDVLRGELDTRPMLRLTRGDVRCTPTVAPAGPP